MSLDFSLIGGEITVDCYCVHCGNEHTQVSSETLFDTNITHNLTKMADEAGVYYALWRPEEKGWKNAKDIVEILEVGLKELKARPEYFAQFNATNGWGTYEHFVPFVEQCLEACEKYPDAILRVSR